MARGFRWVIAHPLWTIFVIAALTVGGASMIPRLRVDTDFANYLNRADPAVIAADEAKDRYGSQIMLMVIVEAPSGIFNPEALGLLEGLGAALAEVPVVEEITGPLDSQVIRGTETSIQIRSVAPRGEAPITQEEIDSYREDVLSDWTTRDFVVSSGETAAAFYVRAVTGVEMIPFAEAVERVVEQFERDNISLSIAGMPYMNLTLGRSMGRDLGIFLPLIIAAIVIVLYASFRWRWGVLLPFAVVAISVVWTLGMMALSGVPITVISFILPVVLMAIGIADGIHVLGRYREETENSGSKNEAILRTMEAMQRPVVLTSLTTAAGFLSLFNAYMIPQRTFGVFTAVGIVAAMLLSLFLIPAVLSLVGIPKRRAVLKSGLELWLGRFAGSIVRHRRRVLLAAAVLAVVFGVGVSLLRIETSQRAFLGETNSAVLSLDLMEEHFSGGEQILIEIDTGRRDGLKEPDILREIAALQEFLEGRGVRRTTSLADIVREMHQRFRADDPAFHTIPDDRRLVAQLLLLFTFQGGDLGSLALGDFSAGEVIGFHAMKTGAEQVALIEDVPAYLEEHFASGETARMVGSTRIQASMFSSIARSQLTSLGTSIAAAGVIVALLMMSLSAGAISLVPLLFTIVVNFGIMSFAGVPLDIATLMVSSITIGIGIDYGIHFIERFREHRRSGEPKNDAIVKAARTAGRAIVYNAIALTLGFSVLLLSTFKGLRNFGLLVAMTMTIGAFAALTVIPAILGSLATTRGGRQRL